MKWFMVLLGLLCLTPPPVGGWRQESFAGNPFQLTSAVGVTPTANGCWTFTNTFTGDQTTLPTGAISGVVPNRANQWATITDISVACTGTVAVGHTLWETDAATLNTQQRPGNELTKLPSCFVIRDGSTSQVLFSAALHYHATSVRTYECGYTLSLAGRLVDIRSECDIASGIMSLECHLTTPIVLDHSGPNPPVFELCPVDPDTHYAPANQGQYYFRLFSSGPTTGYTGVPVNAPDSIKGTVSIQGRYVYNT